MISEPGILCIRGLTLCFLVNLCEFYCLRKENRAMPSSWDEWFWNLHIHIGQFFKKRTEGLLGNRNFWNRNWFCKGEYMWKSEIVGKLCWSCWFLGFVISIHEILWLSKHCFTSLKHSLIVSGYRTDTPSIVN